MSVLRHSGTFLTFFLVFLTYQFSSLLVRPPAIGQDHPFQTEQALSRLSRILGDEAPHPVDSVENDRVRERLTAEIRGMGFEPVIRDDFVCSFRWQQVVCARVQNVLFWVNEPGDNAVMIASHYDSVPAGPGASDDMSGVMTSLEIASVLKGRRLERPLLVLITDGEEVGLLGAKSFVENDPVAKQVGAVVNLEARGVRGPATMFQTSRPNGKALDALVSHDRLPVANSLSADIYEIMPNDTDVSEFLTLDVDALNYAFVEGARYYHTPRDSLENLDAETLFHMGASALASVEALLGQDQNTADSAWVYSDIAGLALLKLPQGWSVVLFAVCGLVLVCCFIINRGRHPVRAAFFPVWSVLSGVLLAVGVTYLISLTRSEVSYAAAHPWALRGVQITAALSGPALGMLFLHRSDNRKTMVLSGWILAAGLGLAITLYLPGAAILFLPPLVLATVGSVFLFLNWGMVFKLFSACAAVLFAVIALPLVALGETALFVENAAPFVAVGLLLAVVSLPLALPDHANSVRSFWLIPGGLGIVLVVFIIQAIRLPAFSPSQPQHISVLHAQTSQETQASNWAIRSGDGLPDEMKAELPFVFGDVPGLPGKRYSIPAPRFSGNEMSVATASDSVDEAGRTLSMNIAAPDADIIWINSETNALNPATFAVNGIEINTHGESISSILCHGRSCRDMVLDFRQDRRATALSMKVMALMYGLGQESNKILQSRPESAVPVQWGDMRVTSSSIIFPEIE